MCGKGHCWRRRTSGDSGSGVSACLVAGSGFGSGFATGASGFVSTTGDRVGVLSASLVSRGGSGLLCVVSGLDRMVVVATAAAMMCSLSCAMRKIRAGWEQESNADYQLGKRASACSTSGPSRRSACSDHIISLRHRALKRRALLTFRRPIVVRLAGLVPQRARPEMTSGPAKRPLAYRHDEYAVGPLSISHPTPPSAQGGTTYACVLRRERRGGWTLFRGRCIVRRIQFVVHAARSPHAST